MTAEVPALHRFKAGRGHEGKASVVSVPLVRKVKSFLGSFQLLSGHIFWQEMAHGHPWPKGRLAKLLFHFSSRYTRRLQRRGLKIVPEDRQPSVSTTAVAILERLLIPSCCLGPSSRPGLSTLNLILKLSGPRTISLPFV